MKRKYKQNKAVLVRKDDLDQDKYFTFLEVESGADLDPSIRGNAATQNTMLRIVTDTQINFKDYVGYKVKIEGEERQRIIRIVNPKPIIQTRSGRTKYEYTIDLT